MQSSQRYKEPRTTSTSPSQEEKLLTVQLTKRNYIYAKIRIMTKVFDAFILPTTQSQTHACQSNSTIASHPQPSSSKKASTLPPINYEAYTEEYGPTHPTYTLSRAKGSLKPRSAASSVWLDAGSEMMRMMPGLLVITESGKEWKES